MSMIAKYVALSEADLDALCANPSLAPELFISIRRGVQASAGGRPQLRVVGASQITPRAQLSLDKAWHGVHYLLCGHAEEAPGDLAKAVMGGRVLGSDPEGFSGYGPARYFKPSDVDVISVALNEPSVARNADARFDADKMDELGIYPGWDDDGDEGRDWALDALRDLCDFYAAASRDRLGIVTCIV